MRSFFAAAALAVAASQACAPSQFFISFANFEADSMSISWATACSSSSVVKYGYSAKALTYGVTGNQSTYTFGGGSYTSPFLHHAVISGLSSSTIIYYTVGGDNSGTSPVMSFTTSPGAALVPDGATFAVIGDLGQTQNSQDTVNHILASPVNLTCLVHVGDLSYADSDEPRWDSWQELIAPLAQSLPWMTITGNHEIELDSNLKTFEAYIARFPTPAINAGTPQESNELFYSFRAAGVHWLMLASYSDFSASSPQAAWLQAELQRVDRNVTPWLIATVHAPWYNSNTAHQGDGDAMKAAFESVLHAGGVDMVLAGHVHAYERSYRNVGGAVDPTGPYYVTIGDGGNREGLASKWLAQPAWSAYRLASYGHGELTVINATALHWTWHINPDAEPTIADDFYVVKGQSARGLSFTAGPASQ